MSLASTFFVASRSFFGRKGAGGGRARGRNYVRGAVFGVALSIVPLTVVLFVADAMIEGITQRYLEASTYHLQAAPYYAVDLDRLVAKARLLGEEEGVIGSFVEIQGPAIALGVGSSGGSAPATVNGALIRAVSPDFLADPGFLRFAKSVSGQLSFQGSNEVILGQALARKLGLGVGDLASFLTAREGGAFEGASPDALSPSSSGGFAPKQTTLRVRGIVSTGYEELDSLWAFVPLKLGSRMLAPGTRRAFIGIKCLSPFGQLEGLRRALEARVGREGEDGPWTVSTWPEIERNLWKSFSTTRALLLLIMALAVSVAAINVGSALIMLSLERRKDIAILKSSGSSSTQIGLIFVEIGAMTGLSGVGLGLGVGCLISYYVNEILAAIEGVLNVFNRGGAGLSTAAQAEGVRLLNPAYYLDRIPVRLSLSEIALVGAMGLGLCVLASLLPARRAARLPPLETIRKS